MWIVDILVCIENGIVSDLVFVCFKVIYYGYDEIIGWMCNFFFNLQFVDLFDGKVWVMESVEFMMYNGIYLDVLYYFYFMMNYFFVEGGE